MRLLVFAVLGGVVATVVAPAAAAQGARPYEGSRAFESTTPIDAHVLSALDAQGLKPANLCSDAVFLRRVYLDVIGTLPDPAASRSFLDDRRAEKRAVLIDALLERQEFADYWAMKWCDLLRVKSEFPINLWPNAVQAYHRWIRDTLRANMPYDEFARALLTSSGSNFRDPAVNFYRAVDSREPSALAAAVALTFMGTRLETWPEDRRADTAAFFSRVAYKYTAEWKEEIVYLDPTPCEAMTVVLPDGVAMEVAPEWDPREVFAVWLLSPDNAWFARNIVNRIWSWLMGRGIIHEPDDIRPDNPPVHPELLRYLERELRLADYDLKHIYRLILNSDTYQQSSIPQSNGPEAEVYFACYPVRRLEAEVLSDALAWIAGEGETYSSLIPEPYTFVPSYERTIALADGSISSSFLEMFGRPARDTGLESERNNAATDKQRLYLLNSTEIQRKIERSPQLNALVRRERGNPDTVIESIYLGVLSRYPTPEESAAVKAYAQRDGMSPKQAVADVVWALVNSKEFLYRH